MNLLVRLLNKLSLLAPRNSSTRPQQVGAIILLAVAFGLCFYMARKVETKLVFIIDDVELGQVASLTVGDQSDICYKNVPHDYLKIIPNDNGYEWQVNEQYHDSLQYFKINNANPNRHVIRNDASQQITLRLPVSAEDTLSVSMTGADVWNTWKDFREQKDVAVRHFATYYMLASRQTSSDENGNRPATDSLRLFRQMQHRAVRSFFHREGDGIDLIILDEQTHLKENGQTIGYARSGIVTSTDAPSLKVQFFAINDYCYTPQGSTGAHFQIDGVCYVMKPTVKLTEWGASHVMLRMVGDADGTARRMQLHYPKPIACIASVDSLQKKAFHSSNTITLKQNNNAFPSTSDLYLPAFSTAINFDLCNLVFSQKSTKGSVQSQSKVNGDSTNASRSDTANAPHLMEEPGGVYLRDNNQQTFTLTEHGLDLIPRFGKLTLQSGRDLLHCRAGYINGSFIFSYLTLPLAVCLLLLLFIWLPFSPVKVSGKNATKLYNSDHIRRYPSYLSLLLVTCMVYCVCKSLIALKLSYTYPYFEKLTGITPVATSLVLLLFFSLTMLFNTPLRHQAARGLRRFFAWLFCLVLAVALGYVFFYVLDKDVGHGVISSYFPSEVYSLLPWRWLKAFGINDTHRSVVYALFFAEAVVLVLWLLADIFWKQAHALAGNLTNPYKSFAKQAREGISRLREASALHWLRQAWQKVKSQKWAEKLLRRNFVFEAFAGAMKILYPGHLILLFLLALMGSKFGNFGTAFITLFVIIGLTQALSSVSVRDESVSRHTVLCEMFFISLAYIAGAMVGDHGYMTNYVGFVMCFVCFFFLMERPKAYGGAIQREARRERRWVTALLCFLIVAVMAMPSICSHLFSTDDVNYDRLARRVMLYSSFDELQRNGYRYSESDAEFMVVMSHYMQAPSEETGLRSSDPLSNDGHFLHASVSSGQSPVVLNDLSVPVAFFGSYGIYVSTLLYFLLLFLLLWIVLPFSLSYTDARNAVLTKPMQWRLLAVFMWVGTSFYIYLSYIDRVPFTGRLNPGFGVDAVGEALESAILLAFMACVACRRKKIYVHSGGVLAAAQ